MAFEGVCDHCWTDGWEWDRNPLPYRSAKPSKSKSTKCRCRLFVDFDLDTSVDEI